MHQPITFSAKLWVYHGEKAAWHFLTLPAEEAAQIRFFNPRPAGFGAVRVQVNIGGSEWQTSLFPDKKSGSYFLPIKAAIRHNEHLTSGDIVTATLHAVAP